MEREEPRYPMVRVDPSIESSYPQRRGSGYVRLAGLKAGWAPPDVAAALLVLRDAVEARGGRLYVTDLYRPMELSDHGHECYKRWLAAGKPAPGSPRWVDGAMKDAYVAPGGKSWHNAGRAVDAALDLLAFREPKAQWLRVLWSVARPLGWQPIVDLPNMGAKEAWHLEYRGPWEALYRAHGLQAVYAARMDQGCEHTSTPEERLQAQLWRCGQDVGSIDGKLGVKTFRGMRALGLLTEERSPTVLHGYPSASR